MLPLKISFVSELLTIVDRLDCAILFGDSVSNDPTVELYMNMRGIYVDKGEPFMGKLTRTTAIYRVHVYGFQLLVL